jgi:hypothetical protein
MEFKQENSIRLQSPKGLPSPWLPKVNFIRLLLGQVVIPVVIGDPYIDFHCSTLS